MAGHRQEPDVVIERRGRYISRLLADAEPSAPGIGAQTCCHHPQNAEWTNEMVATQLR